MSLQHPASRPAVTFGYYVTSLVVCDKTRLQLNICHLDRSSLYNGYSLKFHAMKLLIMTTVRQYKFNISVRHMSLRCIFCTRFCQTISHLWLNINIMKTWHFLHLCIIILTTYSIKDVPLFTDSNCINVDITPTDFLIIFFK